MNSSYLTDNGSSNRFLISSGTWSIILSGNHSFGLASASDKKVILRRSGDDFDLFINGSKLGSTVTVSGTFGPNAVGRIADSMNAEVKEMRVYDRALTDAEIALLN